MLDVGNTADGALRLVDGTAPNGGRLEVNYKGAFGSVCEDNFGTSEAATVCHQLGFAGASSVVPCCQFGQTSGETWLDELDCSSGEVWFTNCTHRGWGVEDCHHGQDVGLVCNGTYVWNNNIHEYDFYECKHLNITARFKINVRMYYLMELCKYIDVGVYLRTCVFIPSQMQGL